jgi:hypothetical protein
MEPTFNYDRLKIGLFRLLTVSALTGVACIGLARSASAQPKQPKTPKLPATMVIYRGDSLQTSGITLANWGSGTTEVDKSKIFSGTESLKITTHGMYQGADLNFVKPVNLSKFLGNKFNYLTIAVQPPSSGAEAGGQGSFPGLSGGLKGGQGFPGFPGVGGGGQGLAGGPPGLGGYGGRSGTVAAQKGRKLENLRVVMVTSGGKTLEAMLPLANATEEADWKVLSIPLTAIPNLTADDAQITEMRIFGDAPGTVNIGSIGIVEDSSPIKLDSINDKTVQRLAKYQYVATASGGATPLVYSWDWDASDGIQDETQGRNITHVFRKASVDEAGKNTDFVVTVTVSDLYNTKAPVKTTFKVHVTP